MPLRPLRIESVDWLRAHAPAWDDLLRRSGVGLPTKRAALLVDWVESFAVDSPFVVLAVADGDRLLAALPLVEDRLAGGLRVGKLPVNCWSSGGDFLLDQSIDATAATGPIVSALRSLRWPLLVFDTVEAESPRWISLRREIASAGLPSSYRRQFEVGLIDIDGDWERYSARWSKNHRKDMARRSRRASEMGELACTIYRDIRPAEVVPLLKQGFEVEERSWKGPQGTAVLRSPEALAFFCRQARMLAEIGALELVFLSLDGWPIAFEYGYHAEGTYFSHKVGYDEAYRMLAPGQLLMQRQLEAYFRLPERRLVNCMGILNEAVAKWCTRSHPIGRLVVGTGGPVGNVLMAGFRRATPAWGRLRSKLGGRTSESTTCKLGAVATRPSAPQPAAPI